MAEQNSLARMLAVLDLFTEDRLEWSSEDMQARLGYSRPTLYRYLKILRQNELLASMNNATFTLGPKVVEMDFLLRRSDPLILESRGYLEGLTTRYPGTAFVSRWYRTKVLCVENACSAPKPKSSYPRGRLMPVGRGAASRAILAFLPTRQAEPLYAACMEEFRAVGFGQTMKEVQKAMRAIRKAGVAIAYGEVTPGVIGVSSPIFDAGNTPIGSLCLTVADTPQARDRVLAIAADIQDAAAGLSGKLAQLRSIERRKVDVEM